MAGMQEIEAAIGEANPPPLPAPALGLLSRDLGRHDFPQHPSLRRNSAEQVALPGNRCPDLPDNNPGRDVREPNGERQLKPGGDARRQSRDHGISRARHVMNLGRLGREMPHTILVEQRHAVLGARYQNGAEAVPLSRSARAAASISASVLDRHPGSLGKLATVRGHDVRPRHKRL